MSENLRDTQVVQGFYRVYIREGITKLGGLVNSYV